MKSLHKLLIAVTILAFTLGYLPAQPVHAGVFIVTNTSGDINIAGSLPKAVFDANSGDTITFSPALAGQTIFLDNEIAFDKDLTIDGSGLAPHVKISGNNAVRVFNITGSNQVNLSHVDIIEGSAEDGGAIYNSANTLAITDVNFSNNLANNNGGAIFNGGYLTIANSTFSDNNAAFGGGIYHFFYTLVMTNSTFSGNTATYKGGAIYNSSSFTGTKITGSSFSNNSAWGLHVGEGGSIYNNTSGHITRIQRTTFSGNESDGFGGSIYNNGTIKRIAVSTFSGNSVLQDGGGIYNNGTISILYRSTFSGNSADYGGGIMNKSDASLLVVNSTFSGNDVDYLGGGIMSDGWLKVINATFSGNGAAYGGGIAAAVNPVTLDGFILVNTIIANSLRGEDCYNLSGDAITFGIGNLIEINGPAGHECGGPWIIDPPLLGPLAYNGFLQTKTHMLDINSPALDAGDNVRCREIDQRGKPRPVNDICDIGAVERQHTIVVAKYRSQAAYDGWLLEASENSGIGGKANDTDFNLKVGDNTENKQYRSILSFDTSKLPNRAVILRVVVRVKKALVLGTNPFDTTDLLADIRKGPFSGNTLLQLTDFQAPASMGASGIFNSTLLKNDWYKVKLKPEALVYINKTGVTQFRLRFKLDDNNNLINDYIMFYSGDENNLLFRPLLKVRYYVP